MRRRDLLRVLGVLIFLAGFALLLPFSPWYLPDLLARRGQYDGRPTSEWIKQLKHEDVEKRSHACFALGVIGAQAAEAVPLLAAILSDDPELEPRVQASLALTKMAPASRKAVDALAKGLEDEDDFVRMNSAVALSRLGADAQPALSTLKRTALEERNRKYLGNFTNSIQDSMSLALGRASSGSEEGVPVLLQVLSNTSSIITKSVVVRALTEIGPPAKAALPALRELLKSDDVDLRDYVQTALKSIDPEGAHKEEKQPGARANPGEPELPVAERERLWEIEHRGNLLVKHGFGPLADALKRNDARALSQFLAEGFVGADLLEPQTIRAASDFLRVERAEGRPAVQPALSRDAFVARLMTLRRLFHGEPRVKLSLMTLSPRQRQDLKGEWEGTALLRMHGEHQPQAPAEVLVQLRYRLSEPSEEVLARPGWLRSASILQTHTAQAPRSLFKEVAQQRGLHPEKLHDNWTAQTFHVSSGGLYVCDFNRDGILDVLVTDISGNYLYRGQLGGTFEDVTRSCGVPHQRTDQRFASWIDMDGDGWEDLLLGGQVLRNMEGKRFVDQTARTRLPLPIDALNVVVADYDRDGKLDLYATRIGLQGGRSWLEGKSSDPGGNALLRNLGNWQFEDVTAKSGTRAEYRSTFSAAWLDANNDGWPDLHVINEFGDGQLLVNKHDGTFAAQGLSAGNADFGSMGLAVGDVNNDGNIDVYCANMYSKAGTRVIGNLAPDAFSPDIMARLHRFVAGSQLHLNRGNLKFDQVGSQMQVASVGWAYGPTLADLDGDGWLDLFANAGFVSRTRDDPDG